MPFLPIIKSAFTHGPSAGSRDSSLTSHGFQQATRLAQYLNTANVKFSHIYSSPLQRTYKTAELICAAQPKAHDGSVVCVKRLPILAEQDFGYYEGKAHIPRPNSSSQSARLQQPDDHKEIPGFEEPESKDSMCARMDMFLDEHLLPLMTGDQSTPDQSVAIVSHGLIMVVLWRRLLRRIPKKSITIASELLTSKTIYDLEHLGNWSNTGYLELCVECSAEAPADITDRKCSPLACTCTVTVAAINKVEHLKNLKRTRGGVGSSKHSEGQKTLDAFFKRQKRD